MSKRILLLVEGHTEERFVKDVLAPKFAPLRADLRPTLLVTKRVKQGPSFKGRISICGVGISPAKGRPM